MKMSSRDLRKIVHLNLIIYPAVPIYFYPQFHILTLNLLAPTTVGARISP